MILLSCIFIKLGMTSDIFEFLIIFPSAAPIDVKRIIGRKSLIVEINILFTLIFLYGIKNDKIIPTKSAKFGFPINLIDL